MTKQKTLYLIVSAGILGAVVAAVAALVVPPKYEATISFAIRQEKPKATVDYQYDGYYTIEAAELFGKTVQSWFSTRPIVKEIYEAAGVAVTDNALPKEAGRFTAKQFSSQNVVVRYSHPDEEIVKKISAAMNTVAEKRGAELVLQSDGNSVFNVDAGEAVIVKNETAWYIAAAAGLIAGAILGTVGIGIATYLKE